MKVKLANLFFAASMPVLKVIIVTLVGSFIALNRINILNEDARHHFNKVVFYVFNPALIYANLAKTLTMKSLVTLWFMPLNIFITFIIGSILGCLVIYITKTPSHLRGLVLGCCSAGNLGNILLIIIPAVCKEKRSPFGDPDVCHKNGMAYASLSLALGAIYLWSYVYNIMRISSSKKNKEVELRGPITGPTEETSNISPKICDEAQLSSIDCSMPEENVYQDALPHGKSDKNIEDPASVKFKQQLKTIARKINLKRLLAPSTIGAIIGFIIGVVGPFRRILIGDDAPLHVLQDSAAFLGEGAIPTVSLIMGGNLIKGWKGSSAHTRIIVGIVVVRYIISPLFGVLIVKGAIHFGLIHSDPLYRFVLLLQFAVPPAMNISTISQLFGAGQNECSVIMLWAYALASVSLTLWSVVFMWLVS
ncbi:hypothetical protein AQUCO_09500017v1 [Aquilegia coerulea]|uniref:Uncharacterized protein n=1 Tax=Aquilegia coerulea TaxID=218851 RepID=A0A2G5C4M9_AQUCA|nr:hypothetical protein AQUCO_09500017v1 [Aquilegia coerulea]PIA26254.1 hypothetical protein AQUCO_09500017v1 [Aquilegia coerulea]